MLFSEALDELGKKAATSVVMSHAELRELPWKGKIQAIWEACWDYPELRPEKGSVHDDAPRAITRWLDSWSTGWGNRSSVLKATPSKTKDDPMLMDIMMAIHADFTPKQLEEIRFAHRLMMAGENVTGAMLEEYLTQELAKVGWVCAWGQTLKYVDFVSERGELLQVKNRSNSENSSSSKVRSGTNIQHWYRMNANNQRMYWPELQEITGCATVTEEGFRAFARELMQKNPDVISIPTMASNDSAGGNEPDKDKSKSFRKPTSSFGGS